MMSSSTAKEPQDLTSATNNSANASEARTGNLFPQYLMKLLNDEVAPQALWWLPDGKAFAICPNNIADQVLDKHFQKTKYSSFIRRLHNEGYRRQTRKYKKMEGVTLSDGTVVLSHAYFQRDHPELLESFYKKQQKASGCDSADRHVTAAATTAAGNTHELPKFQPPSAFQLAAKAEHKMMMNNNTSSKVADTDARLLELLNRSSCTTSPVQKQVQQEQQHKKLFDLNETTASLLGKPASTSSLLLDTARLAGCGPTSTTYLASAAAGAPSADPLDFSAGMASALYNNLTLSQGGPLAAAAAAAATASTKTPTNAASSSSTSSSFGDLTKNIAAFRQARLVDDITDSTLLRQLEQQKQLFVGAGAGGLGASAAAAGESILSRSSSNESMSQRLHQAQQKRTSSSMTPPPLSLTSSSAALGGAPVAAAAAAAIDSQIRLQQLRWDRQLLMEEQQQQGMVTAQQQQQQQQQHRLSAMDALRLRAAAAFTNHSSSTANHQPQWPHFN